MKNRLIAFVVATTVAAALVPLAPAVAAPVNRAACAKAWYDYQYAGIAPGFTTTMSATAAAKFVKQCEQRRLLPGETKRKQLTQNAFNTVAQILEREIARVSMETGKPPCEAMIDVLKPVGAKGAPLRPGDDVEGYAPDSFLPILKYQWFGGPFRLKIAVGCLEYPWANLWLLADPYPPADSHPERYPSDDEVKKAPWPRTPFEGPMSTCITWGPNLKNEGAGGRGVIFGFDWNRENLPLDVRSCYPRALGMEGLGKYPFTRVANLPVR